MNILKRVLLLFLFAGIIAVIIYLWQALPVVSAYGAKNLCSCVFVSDRSPEAVINDDLNFSFIKYGSYDVSFEDSSATGSVFGFAKRKAIYRKGLGCTLVVETTEEDLRNQPNPLKNIPKSSDSLLWPLGIDSLPQEITSEKLVQVVNDAFRSDKYGVNNGTRAIVVLYNGQLIAEQYKEPFDHNTPQLGWSMTKSITNSLIGIMVKQGAFEVTDKAPLEFWKEANRGAITIDDLMRMSSGLEWTESYGGVSEATTMLFKTYNTGLFAAKQELEYEPGTHWYYSSGTTNILSYLIKQQMDLSDYLLYPYTELFAKLGMHSAVLEPDPSGTFVGSSFMYATPRDWSKFGQLYLNKGVWFGTRILPEGWVDYTVQSTENSNGRYGAQFWLNKEHIRYNDVPADAYEMSGFHGQSVTIIPSKNMVITRLALNPEENFDKNRFLADIISCLK